MPWNKKKNTDPQWIIIKLKTFCYHLFMIITIKYLYISWASLSQLTTPAPRLAKYSAMWDLPLAIPPVSPTMYGLSGMFGFRWKQIMHYQYRIFIIFFSLFWLGLFLTVFSSRKSPRNKQTVLIHFQNKFYT